MYRIIKILVELHLPVDETFYSYIIDKIDIINPNFSDMAGCYEKNGVIRAKIPEPTTPKLISIGIHEVGHLYDSYLHNEIIDNEDTALLWEIIYLSKSKQFELLKQRIEEINKAKHSKKYASLCKIKETKQSPFRL